MSVNITRLSEYPLVAIDTETTGLDWYKDKMFGVAVATYNGTRIESQYWDIRETPRILETLRREVPLCKMVINHNIKFDAHFLMNEGVVLPPGRIGCTSVRAALIDEHEPSFSLGALCTKHLKQGKVDIYGELAALFGGLATRNVQMKNLHRAPPSLVAKYATMDPELAIRLWLWQSKEIETQDLHKIWDLERQVMSVIIKMERSGVKIDKERAIASSSKIDDSVRTAQDSLNKLAGGEVNVNSPKQMRVLLKPKKGSDGRWYVGDTLLQSTDGGAPSLDAEAMRTLVTVGNPHAAAVLRIRKILKAKQFLENHILQHEHHGRVYPNYNQTRGENGLGTGTGRFSIDDPALQQIPARDVEIAEITRSCFLPNEGEEWVCFDFKQFEQRWFAHYANDDGVIGMYEKDPNLDFYQIMANLSGVPRNPRYAGEANAKQITLAAIFGMGDGRLAMEMGMPYTIEVSRRGREYLKPGEQAVDALVKFNASVPGIKKHLDMASSIAKSRGYVKTILGRHLRFPGGEFTHKAGGLVLQGTSADMLKLKMVQMDKFLVGTNTRMLLSVHDEIDMSVPEGDKRLTDEMVRVYTTFDGIDTPTCRVPITCNAQYGANWFEASK